MTTFVTLLLFAHGPIGFGPTPLRLLTRAEYDNTVRDLLGDDSRPARAFPREPDERGSFDTDVLGRRVAVPHVEKYIVAAEGLARRAAQRLPAPADPRAFVTSLGRRAYRRPLRPGEVDDLLALHARGGVELVVRHLLQSPYFLYQVEGGTEVAPGVFRLDGWEVASRLSYFLWRSMPDEALFRAAETGALATPAQVRARAAEMLQSPRARDVVVDFHTQWLRLGGLANAEKSREVIPRFGRDLRDSMTGELRAFVEHVVFDDGPGDLATLLAAPFTFVDARLAPIYGVPAPDGAGFTKVALDPTRRAGVLTQLGLLATHATPTRSSPIARGVMVREQLLCDGLSDPPPGSAAKLPPESAAATTRERFARHARDIACSGCHEDIDPIGFTFESYDAVGRWRTHENGHAIDDSGSVEGSDVEGPVHGAAELARRLAGSEKVRGCYVSQWLRFAFGREMTAADQPTVARLRDGFARAGRIRDLLVDIAGSDAFLHRVADGGAR